MRIGLEIFSLVKEERFKLCNCVIPENISKKLVIFDVLKLLKSSDLMEDAPWNIPKMALTLEVSKELKSRVSS